MLGEDHSLLKEFPEYKQTIITLAKSDETFDSLMREYNQLDKDIRKLELRDSPISDHEMLQLKHDRAEMKDKLHHYLVAK
ncbi:MAG: YdcH family protein [Pseudomonadota bacterium]